MRAIEAAVVEGFKNLDTTSVSDAMDRLGIPCGLHGITPVLPGATICGRAFTVRYIPCAPTRGTVGDFLDDVPPGGVVVIDNAGRTDCTVWGDLMTLTATRRGVAGTLIDGVCRDVSGIRREGYPVFSRGCYMVTGKDRVQVDGIEVPVSISGLQVRPGDIILGDDSGALVVPLEKAEQALEIAREIAEKEAMIERVILAGATLREARASVGYHQLQSRIPRG
jgi:regulator of RNase E activity RraA